MIFYVVGCRVDSLHFLFIVKGVGNQGRELDSAIESTFLVLKQCSCKIKQLRLLQQIRTNFCLDRFIIEKVSNFIGIE